MIKKFESYIEDSLNKEAIDNASVINFTAPNGDTYQHILQFVIPYHENVVIDRKKKWAGYEYLYDYKFKFSDFEKLFGSLGGGLVKRTITTAAIVYNGILYRNDQYDLIEYKSKSKKENKPLYVLKYVTIKNGVKAYSEEGLEKLKEMYPDLVYKK
jgi:hypothetical protein